MDTWDEAKRTKTITERGLDFADAEQVFEARNVTVADQRRDYGEPRLITIGPLQGRIVVVVWTRCGDGQRIISMRKANDRETRRFQARMGRPR